MPRALRRWATADAAALINERLEAVFVINRQIVNIGRDVASALAEFGFPVRGDTASTGHAVGG